jgi:hypothetical protein
MDNFVQKIRLLEQAGTNAKPSVRISCAKRLYFREDYQHFRREAELQKISERLLSSIDWSNPDALQRFSDITTLIENIK